MNRSESIASLAAALAKANLELSNPGFDKKNSHFNNGYASLAAVLNAIRQPLAKQGLSLIQTISTEPGSVTITTSLIHASGEWLAADVSVAVAPNANAQAVGSATTYMRRYSALSMCGIAGDDDDAEEDRRDREERRPMAAPTKRSAPPPPPPVKPNGNQPGNPLDKFPDDFDGEVTVKRVTKRDTAWAVQVEHAEYGSAWVKTNVEDYANALSDAVGQARVLGLFRNGPALELTHIKNPKPAPTAQKEEADALPF
jgi:hypothetical protein